MPAIPTVLGQLCTAKMHNEILRMYRVKNPEDDTYQGPLYQKDNSFFKAFAEAVGQGIALGTPTINFKTIDGGLMGAPPLPASGIGKGIIFDAKFFEKTAYTYIREAIISNLGKTMHDPYPASEENSGAFLQGVCKAIGEAIHEHYKKVWILNSNHTTIYLGKGEIKRRMFSGIQEDLVTAQILAKSPMMTGSFWPIMVKQIAKAYKLTIETKSYGEVAIIGVCIPSPAQICGLPGIGIGSGTAT